MSQLVCGVVCDCSQRPRVGQGREGTAFKAESDDANVAFEHAHT